MQSADDIFLAARDIPEPSRRAHYVARACGSDASLRSQVEGLLRDADPADAFFARSGNGLAHTTASLTEKPGDLIGRYKLIKKIGEGGCGVVYEAEQLQPLKRLVALKVIKPGMDTREVLARFDAERQALSLMDHPSIAKVFDAGATETGRPYFVMELVRGVKLTDYCDDQSNCLSIEQRLRLFIEVCHAVQHAHQKGILHRDLKPSNILVTECDGKAVPKIIDFGIAKAITKQRPTDQTDFTAFEQFLGTPGYMSPEQAAAGRVDIDTRSDVYSLGVLLYELLTGRAPFDTAALYRSGVEEIRRIIREDEPLSPSACLTKLTREELTSVAQRRAANAAKLPSLVRGDLDWIVMKCLEKDRGRRYETANDLAGDLQRFLKDEPVSATPPSRLYRSHKFCRRHRRALSTAVTLIGLLLVGAAATTWQAVRATRAETNAVAEAATSRQIAHFLQDTFKAVGPSVARGRDTAMLKELMDRAAERIGRELKGQPVGEAEMRATIGGVYLELGDYAKAEAMYREALNLAKRVYGQEHPEVATALDNVSMVLYRQGKVAGAEALEREVLAMRTRILGNDDPHVAMSLINLAAYLQAEGKLPEAETVNRQALAASRKAFGSDDENSVAALNNLGCVLCLEGKLPEAEGIAREVLTKERKRLGNDHPDVATLVNNLAKILADEGKTREAESTFREALALRTKVLGNDHPDVAQTLDSLAGVLQDQSRLAEAETLYRQALAIRKKVLGDEHPDVANSLNNLADLLDDEGKTAEAEALQREALAMQRKLLGNESPDVARSLHNLARLTRNEGKPAEAEPMLREALATQRKLFGNDHPDVAESLEQLGQVVSDEGRLDEGEKLLRESVSIREKSQPNGWRTFGARSVLGGILLAQKKYTEAEPLLISAYAGLHDRQARIPAANKSRLERTVERLIRLYEETGRSDKAAEWKQKSGELNQPILDTNPKPGPGSK